MKKTYFLTILMLTVFSVFCNASLFARTTPSKNNAFFARTTHVVFGNTSGETEKASTIEFSP